MSAFFDYLTSSAVSLTVSGNTGISPFLTLFLIGIIEINDPEILNMDGTIESILASWYSIAILGVLTLLEFIGKCVPVIDEAIDSIEIFVVPILSILGSLGTFGLLDVIAEAATTTATGDGEGRQLSVGDSFLTAIKVILCIVGVGLALAIHLFKMLIRITGLACCGGCCQPCITVVEVSCVLCGVLFAVFVRQIAIITAIFLFLAAAYALKRTYFTNDPNQPQQRPPTNTPQSNHNGTTTTTTTTVTTTTTTTNGNATSGRGAARPSPTRHDEENPPTTTTTPAAVHPSAPTPPVGLSELTPVPPPPSTNPNYVPSSSDLKDVEPVAVAERVE